MVTDEGGNILEEIEFNAYGEITGGGENVPRTSISEANSNSLSGLENLFVGAYGIKYDGKTNLHYMRYRWYSADQMRFLSPDLLLGINRYAYCHNNPIMLIDYTGLEPISVGLGLVIIVVGSWMGYHAITKSERIVAKLKGVPEYQIRNTINEIDKAAPNNRNAVLKAIIVIDHFKKTYKTHTDARCGKAQVAMYTELFLAFSADKDISVYTGRKKRGVIVPSNYVFVKIKDLPGEIRFYVGADTAISNTTTVILYIPPSNVVHYSDPGF